MSEQEHTLVSKESINTFREVLERYDILFSDISWDAMSFVLRHFLWRNVQRHPALYQDMFNEDDVVRVFEDRILTSLDVLYANDRLPIHSDDEYDKIVQLVETLFAKDGDNVVDAIYVLLDALTGDGSLDDGAVHTQFVTDNPDAMSVVPSLVDDDGDADGDADAQPVADEPSDGTPEQPRDQWADVSVDVDASQDKSETIEPEIINPADISVVPNDAIDDDDGSDDDSDDDIPDIVVGASLSEPEPVIESVVQEPVQEPVTVHTLSMPAAPQVPTMHRANMLSSAPSTSLSYDAQPVHRGRHAAPIVNDNTSKHVDVNKTASDAGLDIDGTGHTSVNDSTVCDNVDDYASFFKLMADRKIDEALALARATNRADMLQMVEIVRGEERERQAAKHYDDVKSIVSDVTADVLADTKDPHVEAMLDAKTQDGDAKTGRDGDSEQLAGTFGFQSTIDMLDDDDDDDDDDLNIGLYNGASSIIDMDDDDEPDDVMSQPVNEPDDALADDTTVSVDERALDADASGLTGDADGVSDVIPDDDAGDDNDDTDDDDDIIVEPSAGMDEQARLGTQHSDAQSDMHNAIVVSDVSHVIDVEPVASVGESNSDDGKNDDADGGDAGNDKNDNNDVDAQHERIEGDDMDGHDADAQHVVQDMPQHDKREVAPSDDDNFVNEFDTLLYEDDPVHSPITTLIDAVDGARDDDTSKQASVDASNGDIPFDASDGDDTPDDINDEPLNDAPVDDVPDDIPDTVPDDIPDDIPEDMPDDMPDDIDADLPPVQHDGDDDDFDDTDGIDDTDDTDGDDDMPQDATPDAQLDDDVPFGQDEPSDDEEDDDDDDDGAGVDDVPQTMSASIDASDDASMHDELDVDAAGHADEHDDVDTSSQVAFQPQQTVVTDTTQLEREPAAAPVGYKDTDAVVHQQNMLDILAGLDIDLSNTGHVSVGSFAGTDNKLDKASTVKNPRSVLAKPRRSDSDSDSDNSGNGNNDGNGGRQVSPETLARFKRRNNDSSTGGRSLARNSDVAAGNANTQQAMAQNNVDPQYDDDAVF